MTNQDTIEIRGYGETYWTGTLDEFWKINSAWMRWHVYSDLLTTLRENGVARFGVYSGVDSYDRGQVYIHLCAQ